MIGIGSDHGGYILKENIKKRFEEKNIQYTDYGCFNEESVDYPNIAKKVAIEVQQKKCDYGILICRSGIGMSIVANKIEGIRATICRTTSDAKMSKSHNDTNIISLGADVTSEIDAMEIIETWLETNFEGNRHEIRVKQIEEIEKTK